jgi:hypothetical protein
MYDDDSRCVYNFITGRTLWYLYRITVSFLRKGLASSDHGGDILNMVYGLIGLGTNTFTEKQQKAYLKSVETLYLRLYDILAAKNDSGGPSLPEQSAAAVLDFRGKRTADSINEWVLLHESRAVNDGRDPDLEALVLHIETLYGAGAEDTERIRRIIAHNKSALYSFANDMQRLDYLIGLLEEERNFPENRQEAPGEDAPLDRLFKIRDAYADLREKAEALMLKNMG